LLLLLLLNRVRWLGALLARRGPLSTMLLLLLLLVRRGSRGRLLRLKGHPLHHPRPYLHLEAQHQQQQHRRVAHRRVAENDQHTSTE
jgi:hypothetical protein